MPLRLLVVASLLVPLPLALPAQPADQQSIIATIDRLFDGMATRDTAKMRATFASEARMMRLNAQQQTVSLGSIDAWLQSVGRAQPGTVIRERTWDHKVQIDGNIAQAWMQYDLHIGDRFSHCGVDAFDLVKLGGEWKILVVMDTRRTTGCTEPPADRR